MLAEIAQLSDTQIDVIESEMKRPQASLSDNARWDILAEKLGLDREIVEYLFSFLAFLNTELDKKASNEAERALLIDSLLSDFEVEHDEDETPEEVASTVHRLKQRLLTLAAHSDGAVFHRKILRLRKGFLRNAKSFSTFVDLRPALNEDRTAIDGFVTIVQMQISTDRDDEEPTILMQLDSEALSKLLEAVVDAQKKVALMESSGYSLDRISNK
ncbi:hypothetical protein [Bradyrhizobium sp. OK095]|uniref:hypothetical protein n=1 Tax=Bradyrhizobium sp. OK095 TaxID=1882760 RepID=UPI000B8057AC|nr:hypothetical protein [Bradyrhizobium sp. OK095]